MANVDFDKRKFWMDKYGNLYPKRNKPYIIIPYKPKNKLKKLRKKFRNPIKGLKLSLFRMIKEH